MNGTYREAMNRGIQVRQINVGTSNGLGIMMRAIRSQDGVRLKAVLLRERIFRTTMPGEDAVLSERS